MEELSASYSLRLCEVCGDQDGQYKCPRCSVLSCSLVCCKKHKASTGCSGRRDKTAFVPMQQFNGANLRSDFHFLEDVLRCKNQAKRVLGAEESNRPARKKPSAKGRAPSAGLSVVSAQNLDNHLPHTRKLVAEVRSHKLNDVIFDSIMFMQAHSLHINLVVMPEGMSRRKTNTSRWNPQRKGIDWRVHLVFIIRPMHAVAPILQRDYLALGPVSVIGDELVSCFCEEVADSTTLRDLIANTMAPSAVPLLLSPMPSFTGAIGELSAAKHCQGAQQTPRQPPLLFAEASFVEQQPLLLRGISFAFYRSKLM